MNNKKTIYFLLLIFIFTFQVYAYETNAMTYFGQTPPKKIPKIFAENILAPNNEFVQDLVISPRGDEIFFVHTANKKNSWSGFTLMTLKHKKNTGWTKPIKAEFTKELKGAFRPYFSPRGDKLYFICEAKPRNIYMTLKLSSGWSQPILMDEPLNSEKTEHSISQSKNNPAYFCSHREGGSGSCDIYSYDEKNKLVTNIWDLNTSKHDCGPVLSPDGRYILFHSTRGGNPDIFAAQKQQNGTWSEVVKLNDDVNTKALEVIPIFSPDGKYIFFTRRAAFKTDSPSKIMWVSSEILNDLF